MPRKKATDQDSVLSHPIIIRVSKPVFDRLEEIRKDGNLNSIGEVARRILSNRKVKLFYKDISMNSTMEELALIRKELKSIGININQITRSFNQDKEGMHRAYYVLKVADLYKEVDVKVDRLLTIVSELAAKWLQKS
ncbi:plasmid mobilization relaxosome protein MobC [Daejeonella sp. JGW-45]|uniref:plasmid mobilization relaxosome protein MobC n=1 Tax=Daejeonella sp. JGW-45 TaxID=3034148 RepID=UPI0023EC1B4A|nr:plasmid mobilization relaxosome protein MobC [Daejeonella sp. JGW-45]